MRNYYNGLLAFGVAVILMFSASCTKVDDTLGDSVIPGGDEHMSLRIDTLGLSQDQMIKVYQTYADSIGRSGSTATMRGSMNLNVGYIGSEIDTYFGKTATASIMTSLPTQPVSPNFFKNKHQGIDSVKLILNMKYVTGKYDTGQKFNVYRLKDSLAYAIDTMYYHGFQYENHIEAGKPLFSFEYSGMPKDVEELKLTVLDNGRVFLDEFMAADTTLYYSGKTSEFLKKFKGFVIAPASDSPADAAIYANYIPNTYINFYFQRDRDQWEIDADKDNKKKTVTAFSQWYMSDKVAGINTSVASIRHDFTGTTLAGVKDGGMVEAPGKAYVRGLGGVAATLEFGEGFFAAIDNLRPSEDYVVFVNQARMFVWVDENSVEAYDKSFQKLGSYINYEKIDIIADYFISDSSDDNVVAPYDGTLNRNSGKGYYEMDISSFMQHAILNDDKESRRLTLAPTYTPYEPFANALTVIKTQGSEHPVTVKLTYTLIKSGK